MHLSGQIETNGFQSNRADKGIYGHRNLIMVDNNLLITSNRLNFVYSQTPPPTQVIIIYSSKMKLGLLWLKYLCFENSERFIGFLSMK